jgi:tetratricopeptide (TPR) repeat protein
VGGAKDLPSRQQTLRSAIGWSYDLLAAEEKTLLARLSVFAGGFSFESAEGVCNATGELDIFSGVESLVRNNLVRQVDSVTDEPRFDMLLTIREYAAEKLHDSGELPEMRQRHADYFGEQSKIMDAMIYGADSPAWLKRIDEEHDNFRTALTYGLANENALEVAVLISAYLSWFWYRFGHFHEGREWSDKALAAAEKVGGFAHGMALLGASLMTMWEGDLDLAARRGHEAVQIFKTLGDEEGLARAHFGYGVILINQGRDQEAYPNLLTAAEMFDQQEENWFRATILVHMANAALGLGEFKEAVARLDQALPIANGFKDPWQLAFCLNNYGEVARAQGQYDRAEQYYRRTEELFRQADAASDHARLVYALAYIALHKEQYEKAHLLFHESLNDFRELGNKRGIAECLAGLAGLAAEQDNAAWAVPLYSAAQALMTSFGGAWWPADRFEQAHALQLMQSDLAADDFARLWEQGQELSMEQAVAYVLGVTAVSYER